MTRTEKVERVANTAGKEAKKTSQKKEGHCKDYEHQVHFPTYPNQVVPGSLVVL